MVTMTYQIFRIQCSSRESWLLPVLSLDQTSNITTISFRLPVVKAQVTLCASFVLWLVYCIEFSFTEDAAAKMQLFAPK